HNVALATLPGFTWPGDLAPPGEYLVEDIVEPPLVLDREGYVPVPQGPGIGVTVRRDRLEALTVRRHVHRAGPSPLANPAARGRSSPGVPGRKGRPEGEKQSNSAITTHGWQRWPANSTYLFVAARNGGSA